MALTQAELMMLTRAFNLFMQDRGEKLLFGDYLVMDTEFTGFSKDDLIYDLGYCLFESGQVTQAESKLLNWGASSHVEYSWWVGRLQRLRAAMLEKGLKPPPTAEHFNAKGVTPEEGLEWFLTVLEAAKARNLPMAGHGIIKVDATRIAAHMEEFIGALFKFRPRDIIDTMALEKLQQMELEPLAGETAFRYQQRVVNCWAPKGTKFNLDYCVEKYELERLYGVKRAEMHGAAYDSFVGSCLLEEMKRLYKTQ